MKIKTQFMKMISGFFGMVLLLAPFTVLAQDSDFYVIPVVQKLKNVVTVAKANGNFTDPVAAANSIKDASADNPYLVVIGPGVYTISQTLEMKPYVDIVGSGENVTKLRGAISGNFIQGSAIIWGASNSTLSSLTVENKGGNGYSVALYNTKVSPRLNNLTAMASGGTSSNFGICNYGSSPTMTHVTASAKGKASAINYGVYNADSSPIMTHITATAKGDASTTNYGVYNTGSSPTMTHVIASAEGETETRETNIGVYNSDSSPAMTNVTACGSGGLTTSGVHNSNSHPTMTGVMATASGLHTIGVHNYNSRPTMTGVIATASGLYSSYGTTAQKSSHPRISRSTVKGDSGSLYATDSTVIISQSTLINKAAFFGTGNIRCIACDNGMGDALPANCILPHP